MKAFKRREQAERRPQFFLWLGVELTSIDDVGVETIEVVISEYGTDLSEFPNEKKFLAHRPLARRQDISGGKPLKERTPRAKNR